MRLDVILAQALIQNLLLHVQEAAVHFDSSEVATAGKSTKEVLRAWVVFQLLTYDFLVDNSLRVCEFHVHLPRSQKHGKMKLHVHNCV